MPSKHLNKDAPRIITIDGPAGAGKSSVAKQLAKRLGYCYLDTGALYRAVTLKAMQQGIDLNNENALVELARDTNVDLNGDVDAMKVLLDGQDVSAAIRRIEVTNNTHFVANVSKVRAVMLDWQREIGRKRDIVLEGRDTGTVIFPQAAHKFYVDADLKERCRRRAQELKAKDQSVDEPKLLEEIKQRDQRDKTRSTAPLVRARDAVLIDSTELSVEECVEVILKIITD